MENFKPAETPVLKKIMFSAYLHVALIFVLVFVAAFFIRQRQRDELRARVEFLKGGPVLVERTQPTTNTGAAADNAASTTEVEEASIANNMGESQGAQTAAAANTTTASAGNSALQAQATAMAVSSNPQAEAVGLRAGNLTVNAANRTSPNRAVIIYAEVDRRVLNTWINEIRAAGQLRSFDSVTMGPLPQISQKLKNPGIKILQQLEISLLSQNSPYEWFAGTHRGADLDNEMGFFSSLIVNEAKESLIRGEIEVQRAFRDPSDPTKAMERISFGGAFEMPMGSGFVMRGLLPGKYASDLSEDNNSDPFLSVFKSRPFRTEETEFALIVDFDANGPLNK